MDYTSLLYAPVYAVLGVPAVLTLCGGQPPMTLMAMDKTAGVVVGGGGRFGSEVETIAPAAAVQATDLADIDLADLRNASLEMNGKTWTVRNHQMKPSPNGEGKGEIWLLLSEESE
ncbi:hypothetical protein [Mesorhizobium sp. M0006]|uniref:hypothetical protein n=1 Tax=Mesorhizobium sp. M0006 TaxID=2956838 RepID=UPI003336AC09